MELRGNFRKVLYKFQLRVRAAPLTWPVSYAKLLRCTHKVQGTSKRGGVESGEWGGGVAVGRLHDVLTNSFFNIKSTWISWRISFCTLCALWHTRHARACICVYDFYASCLYVCVLVNFRCFLAQRPSTIKYRCNYYYYYFYCVVFCCYYCCCCSCSCNCYCSCCCCCRVLLMKFTWYPTMSKNCAHPPRDVTQFLLHLSEVDYKSNCLQWGEGKQEPIVNEGRTESIHSTNEKMNFHKIL